MPVEMKAISGVALVVGAFAMMTWAYYPPLFIRKQNILQNVLVEADCDQSKPINIRIAFSEPRPLTSRIPVSLIFENVMHCKRLEILTENPGSDAKVFKAGTNFDDKPSEAKQDRVSDVKIDMARHKIVFPERSGDWMVLVSGATLARRVSFSSYTMQGIVGFDSSQKFSIEANGSEDYEVVGGDRRSDSRIAENGSMKLSEQDFMHTYRFGDIDALREIFAILIASVFGVGCTLVTEAMLVADRERKARKGASKVQKVP